MENSVTYCRVSTKDQSESLPVQQKKCDDFAASLKFNTIFRFVDSESGRTDDRPQLQAMLKFCSAHRKTVKHVIVSELSRLARNVADQGRIIVQLIQMGIQVHSHNEASLKDDATGTLGKNVVGAFNQYFSDSLSENTKFRMAAAVKEGRFVWRSPVGYLNAKSGRGSIIKPDPARAALVRKGFELMATGRYSADDALRQITALGLTNRKGAAVPRQNWYAMLKNPLYAGWVKSGELLIVGIHEAIVSQKLFDKVQTALKRNSRGNLSRLDIRPDFPLKQFVRCANCDHGLTAGIVKKKFPYLWCYKKGCRAVLVSKETLEASFLTLLGALQPTVEYLNQMPEIAAKQQEARGEGMKQESRALTLRMAEQRRLNSQAIKAKLTGELSSEDFETLKENITEETKKIETALSALESERKALEEVSQQSKLENISLVNTWRQAAVEGKIELQKVLFGGGLCWSHESGFLNRKNKWLMESFLQFFEHLSDPQDAARKMIVRFGGPTRI